MAVFCTKCGVQNEDYAQFCTQCQAALPVIGSRPTAYQADYQAPFQPGYEPIQPPAPMYGQALNADWKRMGADKKIVAGILGMWWAVLAYTSSSLAINAKELSCCSCQF